MSNLTDFANTIATGANASFNGTATPVAGIQGVFGSPEIIGIVGILVIIIIGIKMRFSPDLLIVSSITLLQILTTGAGFPEFIFWISILGGGVIFGFGLLKIIKNR